jgi:hypothetical protein
MIPHPEGTLVARGGAQDEHADDEEQHEAHDACTEPPTSASAGRLCPSHVEFREATLEPEQHPKLLGQLQHIAQRNGRTSDTQTAGIRGEVT